MLFAADGAAQEDGDGPAERIAALVALADPMGDDWESERDAAAAEALLARLAALLSRPGEPDGDALEELVAPGFEAGDPRPVDAAVEAGRGPFGVLRFPPEAFPADAGGGEPWARAPAPFFARLLAPFAGADELRFDFEVVGVGPASEQRFDARVRYEGRALVGVAPVQQDGLWRVVFQRTEGEGARLFSIRPERMDEVRAERRLFEEATLAALGGAGGNAALAALGCEDWIGRIDALGEPNFWGHNGLAVGDVNGDGLEDLYVAMGTGVPNMLFVQNPDGTATERAHEAGVAWLDDTKGVLLIDYDNDGDLDLVCAIGPTVLICDNDGTGHFTPARSLRAATDSSFYGLAAADYDLDGDLDLYAVRYVKATYGESVPVPYHDARNGPRNHLLRNDGAEGFRDVTDAVGLGVNNDRFSMAPFWLDCDGDGKPDLYVANDFGGNNLYRNEGVRFVDVAEEVGVLDLAAGMGVSAADVDLDGREDLLVSNMYVPAGLRITEQPRFQAGRDELRGVLRGHAMGNSLFRNLGEGSFEDWSERSGLRMGRWSWGAVFGDMDGDGLPDVFVPNGFLTNVLDEDVASLFWRQVASRSPSGDEDASAYEEGWAAVTQLMDSGWSWSGRERNCAYLNLGEGTFVDVSYVSGLDFLDDARAAVWCDWDGDGRLDLWVKNRTAPALRFLRNTGLAGGRFLAVQLAGTSSNRDAIGARVLLEAGGRVHVRERRAGEGYLAQAGSWLTFHVGDAERIERLTVHWPGGEAQEVAGLELDRRYRIVQGRAESEELPARAEQLAAGGPLVTERNEAARIVLRTPLALPPSLRRELAAGREPGRPYLLHLWSPSVPGGSAALEALAERSAELAEAGLAVLPLACVPAAEREAAAEAFRARVEPRMQGAGFERVEAAERALDALQLLLENVLPSWSSERLPASVLVDRNDLVAVLYLGPLPAARLLDDALTLGAHPEEVRTRGSHPGIWFFGMPRDLDSLAAALRAGGHAAEAGFYEVLSRVQPGRPR